MKYKIIAIMLLTASFAQSSGFARLRRRLQKNIALAHEQILVHSKPASTMSENPEAPSNEEYIKQIEDRRKKANKDLMKQLQDKL